MSRDGFYFGGISHMKIGFVATGNIESDTLASTNIIVSKQVDKFVQNL